MSLLKLMMASVRSETKFFGLEAGSSEGSQMELAFSVPEGMEAKDVRRQMMLWQRQLDLMTLTAERLRGACSNEVYQTRRKYITESYDKAFGSQDAGEDGASGDDRSGSGPTP